jgi:hypothetical protein
METSSNKVDCHIKNNKAMTNDFSFKLSFNDNLCINIFDDVYCMTVKEWYEENPLAVLVENVVNKGPQLRKDVYAQFLKKIGNVNLLELRSLCQHSC